MKPFEQMLKDDAAPPADPAARRAARQAALAEFTRQNSQAANEALPPRRSVIQVLSGMLRLSRESNSRRSDVMPWYSRRVLLGGAASVCLAVVGGMLVWKTQRSSPEVAWIDPLVLPAAPPASERRTDAPMNAPVAPLDEPANEP